MKFRLLLLLITALSGFDAAAKESLTVLIAYPEQVVAHFETAFERDNPDIDLRILWRQHDALAYLRKPAQCTSPTPAPEAGTGLPVSLTTLSRCAIPFHPGEPDCCSRRLLHSPRPFRQVDRYQWCNEAEPGSLALWLTASLSVTFTHLRHQHFR